MGEALLARFATSRPLQYSHLFCCSSCSQYVMSWRLGAWTEGEGRSVMSTNGTQAARGQAALLATRERAWGRTGRRIFSFSIRNFGSQAVRANSDLNMKSVPQQ